MVRCPAPGGPTGAVELISCTSHAVYVYPPCNGSRFDTRQLVSPPFVLTPTDPLTPVFWFYWHNRRVYHYDTDRAPVLKWGLLVYGCLLLKRIPGTRD